MTFLLHGSTAFRKLDIRKQHCGITTKLVYCSTLLDDSKKFSKVSWRSKSMETT